ncbi:glycosyltransferase [Thermosynechococcaceae cyanobacterium Okahandja]
MKVDIAIFVPSLHGGGAERVMVTLANGFARRGYSVDLVLAQAEGSYLKDVVPQVRIIDLHGRRVIKSLWPLALYLRRNKPAAMLSAMSHANLVAILARFLAGVTTQLVISERSTITMEVKRAKNLSSKIIYALVPRVYPMADKIVAVSQGAARALESFAHLRPSSVHVVYNPFDLEHIEKIAGEAVTHPWFASSQRPVILAIGRLAPEKDFFTLIRAFATFYSRHEARLLILGEGELRDELQTLALSLGLTDDTFQMPGFVDKPFSYLSRARVFVLSSRWEGLPGVLIEAMACGTPVVSTDCPSGPREILENGRWGRLVPVGDVEALAEAIEAVLFAPRETLPNVRKRAQAFDQEEAINHYLNLLGMPLEPA